MTLKFTVSGLRGVWGKGLDLEIINDYLSSFIHYLKSKNDSSNTVVVARDTRKTSPLILDFVSSVLRSYGIRVINLGVLTTPLTLFAIRETKADGGVIITASHNPPEWNALKFVDRGGVFISQDVVNIISSFEKPRVSEWDQVGEEEEVRPDNILRRFINEVEKVIDTELIKNKKFRVGFDPVNGAGSIVGREILEYLGCKVFSINDDISKFPQRGTEPTQSTLKDLSKTVVENGCDIGFALDPDGDRLAVVSNDGEIPGEEFTLPISVFSALKYVSIGSYSKKIVINLSTSSLTEHIASKFGFEIIRSKVGEANVVSTLKEVNGFIGGEGNGGVIFPPINPARDSLVGMILILLLLAKENVKVSEVVSKLPTLEMVKTKTNSVISKEMIKDILDKIQNNYKLVESTDIDGNWFRFDKGWLHIRPSNTEPITRIIFEGDKEFVEYTKKVIENL
ncbi:MAG: phosphoglucosamine mutase [Spirochaetia bacterium]|nr:phosphoglucosamine mutase [Spirochaetota bacterium]MDW8112663.1 phosphoglucosamine mutase [Spirochaetia bacterium]